MLWVIILVAYCSAVRRSSGAKRLEGVELAAAFKTSPQLDAADEPFRLWNDRLIRYRRRPNAALTWLIGSHTIQT